jgi:hypothetical protein
MSPAEIEERKERFRTEYSEELSKLAPEIVENPAFDEIIEYYLAPRAYEVGDYTWGSVRDKDDGPSRTPMLPSEVRIGVSKDGKKLTLMRVATPLKVSGSNFDAQQASISEVELNDDGTISYTDSDGELAPSNERGKKNLRTSYTTQKYDSDGNTIMSAYFQASTYVDRIYLNSIVQHIYDHQPGISQYGEFEGKRYSFYGDLERAYVITRDMKVNPADNRVDIIKPQPMPIGRPRMDISTSFRIADFNFEHPNRFSPYVINSACQSGENVDLSSPFVISFDSATPEKQKEYYQKVEEIQQKLPRSNSTSVEEGIVR